MQLTDPRDLLSQVSVERYQNLLASCRQRKAEPRQKFGYRSKAGTVQSAASIPSTMPVAPEPYLSIRGIAAPKARKPIQGQVNKELDSADEKTIRGKVSALGDFVDTDAVGCPDIFFFQ